MDVKESQEASSRNQKEPRGGETHVHIERLWLDGLPLDARGAAQFQAAFEAELTRTLAATPSAAWSSRSLAQLPLAPVAFTPGGSPTAWGRQAAHSLLAGLTGEAPSVRVRLSAPPRMFKETT